jgi:hypothetical protein
MSWPSMAVTISIPWFSCCSCSSLHTRNYKARGRVLRMPLMLARPLASYCLACTTPPPCTATAAPCRRSPEPRQPSPRLGEQLDEDDGALSSSTPSCTSLHRKHRRAERHPFCVPVAVPSLPERASSTTTRTTASSWSSTVARRLHPGRRSPSTSPIKPEAEPPHSPAGRPPPRLKLHNAVVASSRTNRAPPAMLMLSPAAVSSICWTSFPAASYSGHR